MKTWEAQIPKTPKIKDRKRCFVVWRNVFRHAIHGPDHLRHGGKVVWLTDKQVTFHTLDPALILEEVTEKDTLEEYKKYMDQTI
jgi:hypothetical protein